MDFSFRTGSWCDRAARNDGLGAARRLLVGMVPSWPLIIAIASLARALAQPAALLNDPDTYLHIAAGRWMLAHHALPTQDPFSYSLAGAVWVPHEWLAEVILAMVYDAAGWSGVVWLAAACFAASMALLTRFLLRWFEPFSALIAVMFGGALTLGHLLVRPHILALPLLMLWSAELFAARDSGSAPPLWLLAVIALWANLHGSFMFGLALLLFLGAEAVFSTKCRGREIRRWGFFGLLAIAASMATPNGWAGFVEPFRLVTMPALQTSFGEWMSPNFQRFEPLEIWLLGMMALGLTTGIKLPLSRVLLLVGLSHLALAHIRHAELLGLVGPLAVAASLGPQIAARIGAPLSALGHGFNRLATPARLPALALAAVVAVVISIPIIFRPIERTEDVVTPAAALSAARATRLVGPVFNSEGFGGYLIFSGIPTFIDGRAELYGNDFLSRYLAAEAGDCEKLAALLQEYGVEWTLLAPRQGAAHCLDNFLGWRRVFSDRRAVIHMRG
jgi:hypothetical protein